MEYKQYTTNNNTYITTCTYNTCTTNFYVFCVFDLPFEKGTTLYFDKLKFPPPKNATCQVFGENWFSGSREDQNVKVLVDPLALGKGVGLLSNYLIKDT